MSDAYFDAARQAGEYPPKGWGWKDAEKQRQELTTHFAKLNAKVAPWMKSEARRLGIALPPERSADR